MIRVNWINAAACAGFMLVSVTVAADDFMVQWDEAEAKRLQAADLGYEWRDTRKLLKSAKSESEAGNTDKAMALVQQALEQSLDAIAQAQREKQNWAARVPQ